MNFSIRWGWWLLLAAGALLAACGGGADTTKAQIRLVNASGGYAALDMSIDDSRRFTGVAYGASASYVEADPAKMATTISRPGAATALVSLTPAVSKNKSFTVLAYGGEGALKTLVLDDNTGGPASGKTLLRVVNGAPDAPSVDVYITGSAESLTDAVPLQSAAAVGATGGFATVNSGTWRLRITGAGSKTDVRLDASGLVLGSEQVTTLVVTPGRGGVLVNALLLVDRGSIARADSTQARLRVAAGVTGSGAVSATIGGTALPTVTAPAVGLYTLVSAGTPTLTASVNGTAVAGLPVSTLAAGGDYSLLVYGTASAPQVALIEDDNHLPADASQAKLRLVHGVADVSTALSLTVNFFPVADGVSPGAASAYKLVDPSTTSVFSVTTPGTAAAIYSAVDQILVANRNYTLFVVGASAPGPAVGILRPDR